MPRPVGTTSTPACVCGSHSKLTSPIVTWQPVGHLFDEFVLDTEPCETIGEITDGFVVVECGLTYPALRAGTAHDESTRFVRVGNDAEPVLVASDRTDHRALRRGRRVRHTILVDHLRQRESQGAQPFSTDSRDREHRPSTSFELRCDELCEFGGFRHVCFVEDDDARALGEFPEAAVAREQVDMRRVPLRARRRRRSGRDPDRGSRNPRRARARRTARGGAGNRVPGRVLRWRGDEPGTSATVNVVSPDCTTPRFGTRVVNG